MLARILVTLGLIVLAGGFIFFSANVIWLGTKAFFTKYGPGSKTIGQNTEDDATSYEDKKTENTTDNNTTNK